MPSIVEKLFSLPPIEQRENIPQFLYPRFSKRHDDTYIAYLCFKRTAIVCVMLSLLNWISYAIGASSDFGLFKIDLPQEDFAKAFMFSFPEYAAPITLALFPFHLILFRRHVDPRTTDLLWWNEYFAVRNRRRRKKVLFHSIFALLCLPFCMFCAYGLPYWFLRDHFGNSYPYFLVLLAGYPILFGWLNGWLVVTTGVVWRYLGSYEGK